MKIINEDTYNEKSVIIEFDKDELIVLGVAVEYGLDLSKQKMRDIEANPHGVNKLVEVIAQLKLIDSFLKFYNFLEMVCDKFEDQPFKDKTISSTTEVN